jgi:hypothetical protein
MSEYERGEEGKVRALDSSFAPAIEEQRQALLSTMPVAK